MADGTQMASITRYGALHFSARPESKDGQDQLALANGIGTEAALLSGYGKWPAGRSAPKTLTYEEVILVIAGEFGVEIDGGDTLHAGAGDIIHIRKGATVIYFGQDATLFFVTTIEDVR